MAAGQILGRRRCSHCSSNVYGARTPSPSGSPAPRRLSPAASGAAADSGHSSGAGWTGGGWGTRSPKGRNGGLGNWIFKENFERLEAPGWGKERVDKRLNF